MSAESDQPLSIGAAVGISVGVSVAACALIASIVICLLVRRLQPRRRRDSRRQNGNPTSDGSYFENQYGLSTTQSLRFAEEGTGGAANAAADKHHRRNKDNSDTHRITVKVGTPEDLRFKVCRNSEGVILVATDPADGSRCSREGVREGDQILGVYVNVKAAGSGAHPKEVSELLSLASEYPLVVEFAHAGPVIRGPRDDADAKQHTAQTSAAEVVLRRHRNRQSVDVADGPSTKASVGGVPQQQDQIRQQRHSRKLFSAPPPPEDRDSHFSIRDRRKRRKRQQPAQTTDTLQEEPQPWFERLCGLHCEAVVNEDEWVWMPDLKLVTMPAAEEESRTEDESESTDDIEVLMDEEEAIEMFSTSMLSQHPLERKPLPVATGKVERVFDFYELEEQDVVAEMPPPSELRPVTDCCTQYDGAEAQATTAEDLPAEVQDMWESLPNQSIPAIQTMWQSLTNYKTGGCSYDAAAAVSRSAPAATATASIEEDEDRELAAYLAGAASAVVAGAASASSASSSRTVQEEPTVATMAPTAQRPPPSHPVEDPQLIELSRSMALRDVEVATVILLDSEARRRQQLEEDTGTLSSGRSTVQEDSIDAVLAPDRLALAGPLIDRELDNLEALTDGDNNSSSFGVNVEDEDEDLAAAESLNDDFELAAAEWRATHPQVDQQDEERMDSTFDWE